MGPISNPGRGGAPSTASVLTCAQDRSSAPPPASKVSGPAAGVNSRPIIAVGAIRPRTPIPVTGAVGPTRRTAGPRGRVTRRTTVLSAWSGSRASAHCWAKLVLPVADARSSRARNGASTNRPDSGGSGATCRRCRLSATARPSAASPKTRPAACRSAAWSQAAATSVSCCCWTTSVPRAAATRCAGSMLSCSYQRPGDAGSRAAGARVRRAVPRRRQQRVARRHLVGRVEHVDQGRREAAPPSPGPTTARRARRARASAPASSTWASSAPAIPSPEVDRSTARVPKPSATGRPRIARASDWKSPAGPVANRQWCRPAAPPAAIPGARRQRRPLGGAGIVPQPREPARLERGHHAGEVLGLLGQQAPADQPGQAAPGVGGERVRQRRVGHRDLGGQLGVRPGPAVVEVGQLAPPGGPAHADRQHRQRAARGRRQLHARLLAHHDEAQPGPQPARRRRGRGEQPRQRGLVELDERRGSWTRTCAPPAPGRCGSPAAAASPVTSPGPQQPDRHGRRSGAVDLHLGGRATPGSPGGRRATSGGRSSGPPRRAHGRKTRFGSVIGVLTSPARRGASGRSTPA